MKTKKLCYVLAILLFLCATGVQAVTIDFDNIPGVTGPSTFSAAGPKQVISINNVDGSGIDVELDYGVVLENTANLPANQTALYGTAIFGDPTLGNPLTATFSANIQNFFLDVYNGLTTNIDYRVYDNIGNSASFNLAPNLSGGTTQIGFAATGSIVSIESITSSTSWDFFIDNITFNEDLPPDLNGNPIPEPATILLLGPGLVGFAAFRKKFRK